MKLEVGDYVHIVSGLGKGQTVRVEVLKELPMGTGVGVTLKGDYFAVLNPGNLEVVEGPEDEADNAERS